MKKLANLEGVKSLNRKQQQLIKGGGPCSVYDPDTGWVSGFTVADAQWLYNNEPSVTGYCCASCDQQQ